MNIHATPSKHFSDVVMVVVARRSGKVSPNGACYGETYRCGEIHHQDNTDGVRDSDGSWGETAGPQ